MKRSIRIPPRSATRVLATPLLLALVSLAGLVLGLTGDGWRDVLASLLLLVPVAAFAWHWTHRN